jgi:hypothetical protein
MLDAVVAGDEEGAVSLTARHLERTALVVLADIASDYELRAVPKAMALVHTGMPGLAIAVGS